MRTALAKSFSPRRSGDGSYRSLDAAIVWPAEGYGNHFYLIFYFEYLLAECHKKVATII
jgi:hypothetical protein